MKSKINPKQGLKHEQMPKKQGKKLKRRRKLTSILESCFCFEEDRVFWILRVWPFHSF